MITLSEKTKSTATDKRNTDPYMDRRSGDDRRAVYSIDYFANDGSERRRRNDRRTHGERREDCINVSKWSSVCAEETTIQ